MDHQQARPEVDPPAARLPLVPEHGLFLFTLAESEHASRFVPLFQSAWRRLPDPVRQDLLNWWQQIRETKGQCLCWRGDLIRHVEGGRRIVERPADLPELQTFDWSRVPFIVLTDATPLRNCGASCHQDGIKLEFYAQRLMLVVPAYIEAMVAHELAPPEYRAALDAHPTSIEALVAHELAHVYAASCGERQPPGTQTATWKRYQSNAGVGWEARLVNELIVSWGFPDQREDARFRRRLRNLRRQL
jgi:hypothetical protein